MVNNEEMMAQMEAEYCPPLDNSTFRAIITDYDLSEEEQIQTARMILDMIRQDAEIEEATGFDPSGNSGGVNTNGGEASREQDLQINNATHEDGTASNKSVPEWSSSTDDTSLSQGMSSLDLLEGLEFSGSEDARYGFDHGNGFTDSLEAMDVDSQEAFLLGTFPILKPFDVKFSLKKSKGNINMAIEDLLTQSFLEETGSRRRGIEAFSESSTPAKTRRHKGKKRSQKTEVSEDSTFIDDTPLTIEEGKWEMGRKDVDFICTRTGIPMQQVSSIYHNSGASVRATILSIIDNYPTIDTESEDPIIEINAMELGRDFPSIKRSHLITLVQLTHPFTASAHDLAKALTSTPVSKPGKPKIQVEIRHTPLIIDPSPVITSPSKQHSLNAIYPTHSISSSNTTISPPTDASTYITARNTAFQQASVAYKKSKSDPLMGGAAAYYSQQGRDANVRVKDAESAAADELVRAQCWSGGVDLHGVGVRDAVRIAREKVTEWWVSEEHRRAGGGYVRAGAGEGYKIVTGVGNHSEGGRGKLGPAVARMLIKERWKVQVGSGALMVTGVVRS
ncbi:hypothetical protein MFRU_006g01130 [Monilinia fructicola]|uniref:Smr domain-containing protein n=1 Tax=Monilinia fructicola TaxID=38448 RepID=A0A5M9JCB4_MONFR|nr:hypothetical protein EYC84_009386 [Monilinia fructicola]KAG4032643.1 hypothetical protein MFRU_006g01130 [Monilinia fructicola]